MLDDLELPQVQSITTQDVRALAEHIAVGAAGSVLQNLGRAPETVLVTGVATGTGVTEFVTRLESTRREGLPVTFLADITTDDELDQVIVDDVAFAEVAGKPDRIRYRLTLREYVEPVPPASTGTPGFGLDTLGIDTSILDEALGFIEDLALGLDAAKALLAGLERFSPVLSDFLARLQEFKNRQDAIGQ